MSLDDQINSCLRVLTDDDRPFPYCKLPRSLHFRKTKLQTVYSGTLMCLSIGTPKNNKFSICPKWKIHYFQVSQNLGRVQPHYNLFEYWDT